LESNRRRVLVRLQSPRNNVQNGYSDADLFQRRVVHCIIMRAATLIMRDSPYSSKSQRSAAEDCPRFLSTGGVGIKFAVKLLCRAYMWSYMLPCGPAYMPQWKRLAMVAGQSCIASLQFFPFISRTTILA